jgi:hypothetical protein
LVVGVVVLGIHPLERAEHQVARAVEVVMQTKAAVQALPGKVMLAQIAH